MRQTLTEPEARAVYQVLVAEAGASASSVDVESFVIEFTSEMPTHQWRFQGALGFGGKFRFPQMTIDCYPEDETPDRLQSIDAANKRLADLKASFS